MALWHSLQACATFVLASVRHGTGFSLWASLENAYPTSPAEQNFPSDFV